MKINKLMATALCAAALLTGCSEAVSDPDSTQNSLVNVPSHSEEVSSAKSTSSEAESSAFTSNTPMPSKPTSTASTSITNEIIKDSLKPWIGLIYDGEYDEKHMIEYYYYMDQYKYDYTKVRIYVSPNKNTVGELIGEFDHEAAPFMAFFVSLTPGTNYYRVQLVGNNVESQISDPYEYTASGGSSSIPRYTHTFTAPSYLTVIPDYSDALAMIEQGEEPDGFNVSVQFTCPGCGSKSTYYVWLVQFPYSSDGKIPYTAECSLTGCPYRKHKFSTTIESHAVKIS